MKSFLSLWCLALTFASTGLMSFNALAQSAASASPSTQCILAGRLDDAQRWAPKARGVELLDASGQPLNATNKEALTQVKAVRLSQPALLATCQGNQGLPVGDTNPAKKSAVPAVSANNEPIAVQAVLYPPMRVGGYLVELELQVPNTRVITLMR